MDFLFHLDASCLNENLADRNKIAWFGGLETIKTISSLSHDLQEKVWIWKFEESKIAHEEWARGLRFFPEFKKWALSFNHNLAHNLICTLEARLDRINNMALFIGKLIDKYGAYT
jgi:hypothetical protein